MWEFLQLAGRGHLVYPPLLVHAALSGHELRLTQRRHLMPAGDPDAFPWGLHVECVCNKLVAALRELGFWHPVAPSAAGVPAH